MLRLGAEAPVSKSHQREAPAIPEWDNWRNKLPGTVNTEHHHPHMHQTPSKHGLKYSITVVESVGCDSFIWRVTKLARWATTGWLRFCLTRSTSPWYYSNRNWSYVPIRYPALHNPQVPRLRCSTPCSGMPFSCSRIPGTLLGMNG